MFAVSILAKLSKEMSLMLPERKHHHLSCQHLTQMESLIPPGRS